MPFLGYKSLNCILAGTSILEPMFGWGRNVVTVMLVEPRGIVGVDINQDYVTMTKEKFMDIATGRQVPISINLERLQCVDYE